LQGADNDGENQWPGSGLLGRRGKTTADKVSPAIVQLSRAETSRAKSQKWGKSEGKLKGVKFCEGQGTHFPALHRNKNLNTLAKEKVYLKM